VSLTGTAQGLLDDVGRFLGPHEGCGILVPVVDVKADVPDECGDVVEGAATNRLAGEDPEPGLNEIEPGSALRSEVQMDARVLLEPLADGGCGVSAGVVEDDVEFLATEPGGDCLEELQELRSVGLGAALADHSPARHLEGGIQTRDSCASVVVSLASREPRADRQQRLSPLQGLDLRLLIEAQHDSVGRRIEVQADDIVDSLFRLRVGDELEGLETVRLEVVSLPDTVNRGVGDPRATSNLTRRPLAQAALGLSKGDRNDLSALARGNDRRPTLAGTLEDAGDTLLGDPATDAAHLDRRVSAAASDFGPGHAVGHEQDGPGAAAQASGGGGRPHEFLEITPFLFGERELSRFPGHGMGRCHG